MWKCDDESAGAGSALADLAVTAADVSATASTTRTRSARTTAARVSTAGRMGIATTCHSPGRRESAQGDESREGVAVVGVFASPTILRDAGRVARRHGGRPFRGGQLTQSLRSRYDVSAPVSCGSVASWEAEETLDIEAVHAIAPAANIRYY